MSHPKIFEEIVERSENFTKNIKGEIIEEWHSKDGIEVVKIKIGYVKTKSGRRFKFHRIKNEVRIFEDTPYKQELEKPFINVKLS